MLDPQKFIKRARNCYGFGNTYYDSEGSDAYDDSSEEKYGNFKLEYHTLAHQI